MSRFGFGLLLFVFSLLFTACGKEDDNPPPEPIPENTTGTNASAGQMTADVNGMPWKSTMAYAAQVNTYGLTIIGQFNNQSISVTTNAVIKPGSFDAFSYPLLTGAFALTNNGTTEVWTTLNNPVCKLNITKLDWVAKRISGTFSFDADSQGVAGVKGLKTVTNGVFTDIPLQTTTPLNFSVTAQVNNAAWSGSGMYFSGYWKHYDLTVSESNGDNIMLSGIDLTATGPQNLGSALYSVPGNSPYDFWISSQSTPGTVTVTQFDPIGGTASGSFSFTAIPVFSGSSGPKTVTQGTFTNVPVF